MYIIYVYTLDIYLIKKNIKRPNVEQQRPEPPQRSPPRPSVGPRFLDQIVTGHAAGHGCHGPVDLDDVHVPGHRGHLREAVLRSEAHLEGVKFHGKMQGKCRGNVQTCDGYGVNIMRL